MNNQFVFKKELFEIAMTLEANQKGLGGEFLCAVTQYALYGEQTTTNPVIIAALAGAKNLLIEEQIESKVGRPREYDPQLIRSLAAQGWSTARIAEHIGCSLRTVQRAFKNG